MENSRRRAGLSKANLKEQNEDKEAAEEHQVQMLRPIGREPRGSPTQRPKGIPNSNTQIELRPQGLKDAVLSWDSPD